MYSLKTLEYDQLEDIPMQTFQSQDVLIRLKENNTILLHYINLNTAAKTLNSSSSLLSLSGFEFYKPSTLNELLSINQNSWFEFDSTEVKLISGKRRPISSCLNSEKGDGGYLQGTFSKTFGKSALFDLSWAYKNSYNITFGVEPNFAVAGTIGFSTTYSCNVPANGTGQVFIQPTYIQFENPRFRRVDLIEKKNSWISNPFSLEQFHLEVFDWEVTPSFQSINYRVSPIVTCVTDNSFLECEQDFGDI